MTQTVTVDVVGTNDTAVISVVDTDSDSETLTETNAGLTKDGTLTVNDVDTLDTVAMTKVSSVAHTGPIGGLTDADLLSYFSIDPASLSADTGDTHNLNWHFNSGSEAFNFLSATDTLVLTYTVQGQDDSLAINDTTTHDVTITINGTNEPEGGGGEENQAPVANNDTWIISQQTDVGHDVIITPDWFLHNDTDPDGDPLYVTNVTLAGGGALGGNWTTNYDGSGHLTSISLNNLGGSDVALDYTLSDETTTSTGHVAITSQAITGTDDTINLSSSIYDYSWIDGVGGDDTLTAGPGIDTLAGGSGKDTLIGSSNMDTFVYGTTAASQVTYKTSGPHAGDIDTDSRDTIQNFTSGTDKFDFAAISGITGFDTNLGDGLAAHSIGWVTSGGDTTVYVNNTASAEITTAGATDSADMEIHVAGVAALLNSDFILI